MQKKVLGHCVESHGVESHGVEGHGVEKLFKKFVEKRAF
jgi:hypothetical protein